MTTYAPASSVIFFRTKEAFGGLSNMCSGYPCHLPGLPVEITPTSEALYQACRFPDHPEIQRMILETKNPMRAKMASKPHRHLTRPDWEEGGARVVAMAWALRVKLWSNPHSFGELLLSTGLAPIVERSSRDPFWGALRQEDETLVGTNTLGQLLVALREDVREHGAPRVVLPPVLPNFRLVGTLVPTFE